MILKPSIRSNIFTNAHPLGCELNVLKQIEEAKKQPTFEGPKNVLIIGGSSGYGLSSRIALAFGSKANTINVSFESAPKGNRSGSAGWWNNVYFHKHIKQEPTIHKDFIGDAFGSEMKENVINYIKETFKTVDLVIYSLAAGGRRDEKTGETVKSHIKTIGTEGVGKTIDIADLSVKELVVSPANEEEIKETVFVMGGSDWQDWIERLDENQCLNQGAKTISYTYIGGPTTDKIYRGGTLGKAKEDLEQRAVFMHSLLNQKYGGEALISSSKAVVTKASVFIPQMPHYVSCLFEVMMKHGVHETIFEHKYRLFKDMVYGKKRIVDDHSRIRIDHKEMQEDIQKETIHLMNHISDEDFFKLEGTQRFLKEVFQIHGFSYDEIDYEKDINMEELSLLKPE